MNLHKSNQKDFVPDALDSTIRWALHDLVSEAEPAAHGWERLKERIIRQGSGAPQQTVKTVRWWHSLPLPRIQVGLHVPLYDWNVNRVSQTMRILENRMAVMRVVS